MKWRHAMPERHVHVSHALADAHGYWRTLCICDGQQAAILREVAHTMNACWARVKARTPELQGSAVGIVGHSLGSVIG
jgi:hypothetical protein